MSEAALISVVDDDLSVRESLEDLLLSEGYRVGSFASAEAFLDSPDRKKSQCLILDVRLTGMSGPELQRELRDAPSSPPIIFITAHGDEATRSQVMEEGAVECFIKPFSDDDLLETVESVLSGDESG